MSLQGRALCASPWLLVSWLLLGSTMVEGKEAPAPTSRTASSAQPELSDKLAELSLPEQGYKLDCGVGGSGELLEDSFELAPPTAEQLRALSLLEREAAAFQRDGREFDGKLEQIVRHHFEERRRRVSQHLEREIEIERKALAQAREEAIDRLESFVARYDGDAADAQATPDAMFRLAALYEERARADFDADLSQALEPSMRLYRAVAVQFPGYRDVAAVLYYLGHAYADAGRIDESQQAFRSLACADRFQLLEEKGSESGIVVQALPQDHSQEFWSAWYNRNPVPIDQAGTSTDQSILGVPEEELRFRDPYQGCQAVSAEQSSREPRYVAEVWWQIGNYHFDSLDRAAGPYGLNRAVSAYSQSLQFKKPPLYGVAMYKRAWTLYKQQRYRDAAAAFVELLDYADEQQRMTGDPGADFRSEAYTYIAGSLTYVDFIGPPGDAPFIPRSDVLDLEADPLVAEEKMSIAIERVQEPELIPQRKPWTVEIYKALGREFVQLGQFRNAIATMETLVRRFPLDPEAPKTVAKAADLYDELARLSPPESVTRDDYQSAALAMRTSLSSYVGDSAWTRANEGNKQALELAQQLVRDGLRSAAADHTNRARAARAQAAQLSDETARRALLEQAIDSYRLAAKGWGGLLSQDEQASDAYESRFWWADALYWVAVLQVDLGRKPTNQEVENARRAAVAVRESNEDDRFEQPAAYYVVTLAEKVLDADAELYVRSGGSSGRARRTEVTFKTEEGRRRVEKLPLPPPVQQAVCAREQYNARIPLEEDPERNGLLYMLQAADYFFVHGQFDEARRRYIPLYQKYCGKNEWGHQAWERLISMSNFDGDSKQSRALVESMSCGYNEETRLAEEAIRHPVRQGMAYFEARDLFDQAMKMSPSTERDRAWREAAAAYGFALGEAPERDEAPEAAMNGAFAYKQVGEYDKAIAMYELFIKEYGSEKVLSSLATEAPERYQERVQFLGQAYQALASAEVLFFDYPKAAETFAQIAKSERFPVEERKQAAKQALMLAINLGDGAATLSAREIFLALEERPEERAEVDFLIASAALKDWDANSPDRGANQAARGRVIASMDRYYNQNKASPSSARWVVQAAYQAAVARRAGRSANESVWWKNTIAAFARFATSAPASGGQSSALGTPEAAMAAEAEYTLIDQSLAKSFDYEAGHHRYEGSPVEVIEAFAKDAEVAKQWYLALQKVVDLYASQKWAAVAIARQGSLYDSLRTGLYNTRAPELKMFTPKQERALRIAENSENEALLDKADQIRFAVGDAWRNKRDQELDSADRIVVDRYAVAVMLAQRYNLSDPAVTRALRRLAFLADVVGEAKMSEYTASNQALSYRAGMFQRLRPGVFSRPELAELQLPAPWGLGNERPPGASKISSLLAEGDAAYRIGDLKKAEGSYRAARKAAPQDQEPLLALSMLRARSSDLQGAQKLLEQASSLARAASQPPVARALVLAALGQDSNALSVLKAALGKTKNRAAILAAMAEVHSVFGRSSQAQELAQKALKEDPDYKPAMVTLARDHYRARRIDLCLYTLQGIVEGFGDANPPRDPESAEAHLLRGEILSARGLRGPAMEAFEKAALARPDLVDAHLGLATYMLEAGNAQGAAPHLAMAVRFDLTNAAAHLMLGDAYRLLGRVEQALQEFTWVIAAAPELVEAHYDAGLLLLAAERVPTMTPLAAVEESLKHLRAYKARAPRGGPDDVDELITRAETKKAVLEAAQQQ